MSMFSTLAAEAHLQVVREAIAKAMDKAKTEEARKLLREVLKECENEIAE
jgi:hypothetical protein